MELYNDDCFNILPNITRKVDLVLVDLPYGQTECEWDIKIDLKKMWEELNKICKDNCIYVFFVTTKFGIDIINSKPKWFRYDIVWEKNHKVGFLNVNKQPLRQHEMIYVFYQKMGTYNPQKTVGEPYNKIINRQKANTIYGERRCAEIFTVANTGDRHPTSIMRASNHVACKNHPTGKPVELLELLVKTYSNENDTVLDFTMGCGSTGVACKNTKRYFIGIEKEEKYFKICKELLNINLETVQSE